MAPASEVTLKQHKPNVVFLLVDDLGIKDLSCYGSSFHESPNIDKLASQGALYTNAYASHPVCGPSRSAIMTGKLPYRLGLDCIDGAIPDGETTWPKALKQDGYSTYFLGKWHMGNPDTVHANGFDVNIAGHEAGQPVDYYFPYKGEPASQNVPDMEDGKPGDYLTDALTDKALKLLDENGDNPFLLFFSYSQVHKPACANAQGRREDVKYFEDKVAKMPAVDPSLRKDIRGGHVVESVRAQRNPEYAGQIKALDDSVGRIMGKLEDMGVADNTIIIFTSDQGSMCTSKIGVSTADPYLFGKSFLFEGGLRVPFIIKWPEHAGAGTTNNTVTINTDIYPTVIDMVGLAQNEKQHRDGISLSGTSGGRIMPFDRTFYWTYPHDHSLGHKASLAVRKGPHKLVHWPENGATELYNVDEDISESSDISKENPELTVELFELLKKWNPSGNISATIGKRAATGEAKVK